LAVVVVVQDLVKLAEQAFLEVLEEHLLQILAVLEVQVQQGKVMLEPHQSEAQGRQVVAVEQERLVQSNQTLTVPLEALD
jgi:hypothetical protein